MANINKLDTQQPYTTLMAVCTRWWRCHAPLCQIWGEDLLEMKSRIQVKSIGVEKKLMVTQC